MWLVFSKCFNSQNCFMTVLEKIVEAWKEFHNWDRYCTLGNIKFSKPVEKEDLGFDFKSPFHLQDSIFCLFNLESTFSYIINKKIFVVLECSVIPGLIIPLHSKKELCYILPLMLTLQWAKWLCHTVTILEPLPGPWKLGFFISFCIVSMRKGRRR